MIQQRWIVLLCLIPLLIASCDQVSWPNASSDDSDEVPAVVQDDGQTAVDEGDESEPAGSQDDVDGSSDEGEGAEDAGSGADEEAEDEAGGPMTGAAPPLSASNGAAGLFDMLSEGEAERAASLAMASDDVQAFTAAAEPRMGAGSAGEVSALADRPSCSCGGGGTSTRSTRRLLVEMMWR